MTHSTVQKLCIDMSNLDKLTQNFQAIDKVEMLDLALNVGDQRALALGFHTPLAAKRTALLSWILTGKTDRIMWLNCLGISQTTEPITTSWNKESDLSLSALRCTSSRALLPNSRCPYRPHIRPQRSCYLAPR